MSTCDLRKMSLKISNFFLCTYSSRVYFLIKLKGLLAHAYYALNTNNSETIMCV